jgi:undecaprenyl-diphosphatase
MFGATALSMFEFYRDGGSFGHDEITLLVIGNVIAFLVAMAAIKSFIAFLTRHGFVVFGYYRILAGSIILILYYLGIQLSVV